MSSGIVICSVCSGEVHQDGPRSDGPRAWRHCHAKTALCPDATVIYPTSTAAIVGPWCGRDGGPFDASGPEHGFRNPTHRVPRIQQFPKKVFASFRNPTRQKAEA